MQANSDTEYHFSDGMQCESPVSTKFEALQVCMSVRAVTGTGKVHGLQSAPLAVSVIDEVGVGCAGNHLCDGGAE